jgi:hypothetical protein
MILTHHIGDVHHRPPHSPVHLCHLAKLTALILPGQLATGPAPQQQAPCIELSATKAASSRWVGIVHGVVHAVHGVLWKAGMPCSLASVPLFSGVVCREKVMIIEMPLVTGIHVLHTQGIVNLLGDLAS